MAENAGEKQPGRGPGKPFEPGQSGNPAGKAKGTRNAATLAIEALFEGEAEAIGRRAVELALGGDSTALRLVLERIAPVRRGRPVTFTLPDIARPADIPAALSLILQATAAGELTPDEAATIAGILETKRRAIELVEVEARIAALEQKEAKR